MALSLGDISIGAEGLYLGDILIGADNATMPPPAPLPPLTIDWIIVGGGGGGGWKGQNVDWYGGGAGGAGAVVTGSTELTDEFSIVLDLGSGGGGADTFDTDTGDGAGSSITWVGNTETLDFSALGGGYGGSGNDNTPGSGRAIGHDAGSGGGGASYWSEGGTLIFNATGGDSVQFSENSYGFGQDGCNGGTSFAVSARRGGSGGSGKPTSNTNCPFPDGGYVWVDGNIYAIGGSSDSTDVPPAGKGNGGNCNQDGRSGCAVIRYAGTTQRATGGTITTAGGYTYHTFNFTGADQYFENL